MGSTQVEATGPRPGTALNNRFHPYVSLDVTYAPVCARAGRTRTRTRGSLMEASPHPVRTRRRPGRRIAPVLAVASVLLAAGCGDGSGSADADTGGKAGSKTGSGGA